MLKSGSDQDFSYPGYMDGTSELVGSSVAKSRIESARPVAAKYRSYAENMNAVVKLPEGYNTLLVYNDAGELRGETQSRIVGDQELSFITIYGDQPEQLRFYISDGLREQATVNMFGFLGNDVIGSVAYPLVLGEREASLLILPNPFENILTVTLSSEQDQEAVIQLYAITGQLLFAERHTVVSGINTLNLSPNLASGIYLVKVAINGRTLQTTVVKK